jgi:RHS repeat-associated protein
MDNTDLANWYLDDVTVVSGGTGTLTAITPPAGWTAVTKSGVAGEQLTTWTHTVAAGDPVSWSFGLSQSTKAVAAVSAYSAVDPVTPIDVSATGSNISGTSHTAPSVVTTGANDLAVTVTSPIVVATMTPPAGSTERADQSGGTGVRTLSVETSDFPKAVAGATGTKVTVSTTAAISATATLALRQLATPGPTTYTRYYTFGGETIAMRQGTTGTGGDTLQWMFGNHQGSTSLTTVAGSTTASRNRYLPYGGLRGADAITTTDRGFLGQTEDTATGLDYLNARYHDPTLGKFVSVDPLVDVTRDAYGYGHNNPVSFSDPSGLCTTNEFGVCQSGEGSGPAWGAARLSDDELLYAWTEAGANPGDDYWNPGGLNVCIGALACLNAAQYYNHTHDRSGALDIAGGYCSAHAYSNTCERNMYGNEQIRNTFLAVIGFIALAEKPCASFRADTSVVMADGSRKKISDVKVGDWVLATDPVTGKTSFRVVTATMVHDDNDLLDLVVRTDHGDETIHTTDHHRAWDETRRAWSLAIDLSVGDQLRSANDKAMFVERLVRISGHSPMLDLTIDTDHTFYVDGGLGGILVHNIECGRDAGGRYTSGNSGSGKAAEEAVLQDYELQTGRAVVRGQVRASVNGADNVRYYDGLSLKSDGTYEGIEVKSGTSPYNGGQRAFDGQVSPSNPATAKMNGQEIEITSVKVINK